ncbi:MAG: hypothetical protein MZV64_71785 [Ignavibacteriales bacterium]|nr:hypothetical protein [Ignavibacteriales bacterium]
MKCRVFHADRLHDRQGPGDGELFDRRHRHFQPPACRFIRRRNHSNHIESLIQQLLQGWQRR